jgi:nucleotide-binding universal stress UspA family protein
MLLDRILLPLDGSELAEATLGQVCRLLRLKDAQIVLVQAVPVPAQAGVDVGPLLVDLKEEAQRYITAIERHLRKEGTSVRGIVKVGSEAATILETASDQDATLIVMATHGRTGLSRFVFGSVAEKVLRAADTPLLLIRSYAAAAPGAPRTAPGEMPFKRILLPVDGSEASLSILPHVIDLAKRVGSSVLVLGVVEPTREGKEGEGDPLIRIASKRLSDAGIPVDPVVRLGDPASEILDAAKRHEADLIAMSTHGRSGPSRWVLGSVTEKVLRAAPVPMLVVREKKSDR